MASWKVAQVADAEHEAKYTTFASASKFFAVDASGSTVGSIMLSERDFAKAVNGASATTNTNPVAKWGSTCDNPSRDWSSFKWDSAKRYTYPSCIMRNKDALSAILESDMWFLITDGEIYTWEMTQMVELAEETGVFACPTVLLITSYQGQSPNDVDVSVGFACFAHCQDALCLFKNHQTGRMYVIAAKGCFASLDRATNRDTWEGLTRFENEAALLKEIEACNVKIPAAGTRKSLPSGISLGDEWNAAHEKPTTVELEPLLRSGFLSDTDLKLLLADEALHNLSLAYKSRSRLSEFRRFLQQQKVREVSIQFKDVSGASTLIEQLGQPGLPEKQKAELQSQLREAHLTNRKHYVNAKNSDTAGDVARVRNKLVDEALRSLADIEKASYTAGLLSRRSNRARRAGDVSADADVEISTMDLDAPSCRGFCPICCGEDEIMSVALKVLDSWAAAANTADFALDFPLAAGRFPANLNIVSSQSVCFQCALFGRPGYTMVGEALGAVIPTLEYTGANKLYINQQLYKALNGRLKTGVPVLGQLFATVLDQTLQTKAWAGAGEDESMDPEIRQRQTAMSWLVRSILTNLQCRETFSELGQYCKYPQALIWAKKDYHAEGLKSWAISYPVLGFMQLLRFGQVLEVFSKDVVTQMTATKLLHSFVSAYLVELLKNGNKDKKWTGQFLPLIYAEFNSNLVPRDLGKDGTVVTCVDTFWAALGRLSMEPALLENWTTTDKVNIMARVQLLAFWLIYFQHGHTSAQTYFANITHSEPLAPALLDVNTPFPQSLALPILLSPFLDRSSILNSPLAASHATSIVPFATPFGPSVLRCGSEGCNTSFLPVDLQTTDLSTVKWTPRLLDQLRHKRARHLIQAFGASSSYENNETGLPAPTLSPSRPSSMHTTMHVSVAKTWAGLAAPEQRALAAAIEASVSGEEVEAFVKAVREHLCAAGRGDVFTAVLDEHIRGVLPSFLVAMRRGLAMQGWESGAEVVLYRHDFAQARLETKVMWEVEAERLRE